MGSKLLFRFRSGTHGLNEELGRHAYVHKVSCGIFDLSIWCVFY